MPVSPSPQARGRVGEQLVSLRLVERGYNVARPDYDEGIDLIAFREEEGRIKYFALQVKTATYTEKAKYSITIHKRKMLEDPSFYLVFCLINPGYRFLLMSYQEWKSTMGRSLETESWKRGSYTFHIPRGLGPWAEYLDDNFSRLE